MRIWMIIPALALAAASGIVLSASLSGSTDAALSGQGLAQTPADPVQPDAPLSDACVWTAEIAKSGELESCAELVSANSGKAATALVWPDDFIALTAAAAVTAWDATVSLLPDLYDYVFHEDKEPVV